MPQTEVTLTRSAVGTTATWTGQVTVPADDGELRLIVEQERLFADGGPEAVTSRVVYATAVPV